MTIHHGSHAGLFARFEAATVPPGRLDAIIVPTARPGSHLAAAQRAAADLGCRLLCLASRGSDPDDILDNPDAARADTIVVDTSEVLDRLLPSLSTTSLVAKRGFGRTTDLSGKRNLGLLISQALGWNKILFLDDDIRELSTTDLRALAGLLDTHDAVGLGNTGFPDNSVVCHAYRDVDGHQETFVSGGLLSVRADRMDGFFPDIYNEDWFFLHDAVGIACTGSANQDYYDPFEFPQRARDEELGDCLAEGLYWLRDENNPPTDALDESFWGGYLTNRLSLVDEIERRLIEEWRGSATDRARRLAALAAARDTHLRITPELCVEFIRAWRADVAVWRSHRDHDPRPATIEDCLYALERRHSAVNSVDWHSRVHRPA